MNFSFLEFWKWEVSIGFGILIFDTCREDGLCFALLGFGWDKEERILGIDIFWKYFEIQL